MSRILTLALSKGRILDETLPLLKKANIQLNEDPQSSRKLIFETNVSHIRVIILRATDVPTFVAHGGADFGVVGKDILMEQGAQNVYELLDLKIACCRLMVAGLVNEQLPLNRRLRIATKYVNITQSYYAQQGQQVDIIKLYGAMELAPHVGLADRIVDVVDTGNTLTANGLQPLEFIMSISARLIVNKAAFKVHHTQLKPIIDDLAAAL